MTLKDILKSDIEISPTLLKENNIKAASLDDDLEISVNEIPRLLEIEETLLKMYPMSNIIRFFLIRTYSALERYSDAYKNASILYKNNYFKDTMSLVMHMLGFLQGKNNARQVNCKSDNPRSLVKANARALIYKNEYVLARRIIGKAIGINTISKEDRLTFQLVKACSIKIQNDLFSYIDNLDINSLDRYFKNINHRRDVDKLLMNLTDILYMASRGLIINKIDADVKAKDIYDAVANHDLDFLVEKGHGQELVKHMSEKILELNQENLVANYQGYMNDYLNVLVEKMYYYLVEKDVTSAKEEFLNYLKEASLLGKVPELATLTDKIFESIASDIDNFENYLPTLVDMAMEVERTNDLVNLYYLKERIKEITLKKRKRIKKSSKLYEYDLTYNYGVNTEKNIALMEKGIFKLQDIFFYSNKQDYSYYLAVYARVCYQHGYVEEGDTLISMVESREDFKEDLELRNYVNLIKEYRLSLITGRIDESFAETLKRCL